MKAASVYKMLRIIRDNPGANRTQLARAYGADTGSAAVGVSLKIIREAGWATVDRGSVGRHCRLNLTPTGGHVLALVELLEAME